MSLLSRATSMVGASNIARTVRWGTSRFNASRQLGSFAVSSSSPVSSLFASQSAPASMFSTTPRSLNAEKEAAMRDFLEAAGSSPKDPSRAEAHVIKLADELAALNIIELNQVMILLGHKLGFSDDELTMLKTGGFGGGFSSGGAAAGGAAPAPAAAAAAAPAEAATPVAAKTHMKVIVEKIGDGPQAKFNVIKLLKAAKNLSLADAKNLADKPPFTYHDELPIEEAKKAKEELEKIGATVKLE